MLILVKVVSVFVMGIFYVIVGIKHFQDPSWFVQIIPPILPYKYELVYLSGFFEILLGILLMIPRFQSTAAKGLIILLICVYPANIYLAQTNGAARAYLHLLRGEDYLFNLSSLVSLTGIQRNR